jgi:parallel beta-helix repeat protein
VSVSNSNTLTDVTASSNQYGIRIYHNSDNNVINNSHIEGNSGAGIWFDENGGNYPEYNLIYNNYLSNSGVYGNTRIDPGIPNPNYFNTALDCVGETNIIGGSCLGGNYWATPTGTGYSEGCSDTSPEDGICDSPYNIPGVSWEDEYPLTNVTTLLLDCAYYSNEIQIASPGSTITLTENLLEVDGTCIDFGGADDITFDCNGYTISGDGDDVGYGVYLPSNSNSNTLQNCGNISYFDRGVYLLASDDNTLTDITTSSNSDYGVFISESDYNTLTDIIISDNNRGLYINNSYYNMVSKVTAVSNTEGVYIYQSDRNILTDMTTVSNTYGVYLYQSDTNTFADLTSTSNNPGSGIALRMSWYNTFTDITSNSNQYGIRMYQDSDYNTINDSYIEANTAAGIWLDESGSDPEYNLIYNNYFNNNQNMIIDSGIINENYFNASEDCTKTNIIGGSCIGGNYWSDPTGTGHSETCSDFLQPYGICDDPYEIASYPWAWDYLPLTDVSAGTPCSSCAECSGLLVNANPGEIVRLDNDVTINGDCITFGGSENVTLDCGDNTITGTGLENSGGVWTSGKWNTLKNCKIEEFEYGVFDSAHAGGYTTFINVETRNTEWTGFYIDGDHNTFIDVLSYRAGWLAPESFQSGFFVGGSNNTFINATSIESWGPGFRIEGDNNTFINVTSSGSAVYGIGFYLRTASNNIFEGMTANDHRGTPGRNAGIFLDMNADNNTFINITANNNRRGISMYFSYDNKFIGGTVSENRFGIYHESGALSSTYTGMTISGNGAYGASALGGLFYNNIFNNTLNTDSSGYFNTTLDCSTKNIIGGPCIGGNYWTSPGSADCPGNGAPYPLSDVCYRWVIWQVPACCQTWDWTCDAAYDNCPYIPGDPTKLFFDYSGTCTDDISPFGICDDPYEIDPADPSGWDYFPLTN